MFYFTSKEKEESYDREDELIIARNEIFARRGRLFDDDDLRRYFNGKSWYQGTIAPDDFSEDMLSDVEKYNVVGRRRT